MPNIIWPSKYVKPENVKDGDKITIKSEADFIYSDTLEKDVLEMRVMLPNGEEKIMSVNKGSFEWLSKTYGPSSDAWVGKEVPIYKVRMDVFGKVRMVVYIGIIEGEDIKDDIPTIED